MFQLVGYSRYRIISQKTLTQVKNIRHFSFRPNFSSKKRIDVGGGVTRRKTHSLTISNKIFTPNDFSFQISASIYRENIAKLNTEIRKDYDFTKLIDHVKTVQSYELNASPCFGSLVHFKSGQTDSSDFTDNFGIVLNDLNFSLSTPSKFNVLLANGAIKEIYHSEISFVLPKFINRGLVKNELNDTSVLDKELVVHLTYTLNVFLSFFIDICNDILSKDLIRTIYLKSSFINYQSSLDLKKFTTDLFNESKSIRNQLSLKVNPFSCHALFLSCHFLIFNDPIHFRWVESKTTLFNKMSPLNQLTTRYFKNPILLSENLENIFMQPNDIIYKSYFYILSKSNHFQIFNILKSDQNFKRLILLIKYALVYPNEKLLLKLKHLLPIEGDLTPKLLNDFLVKIGIYNGSTNPILASGIYGFNMQNPSDLSLSVQNIDELQYSENRGIQSDQLPKYLQRFKPLKHLEITLEGNLNKVKEKFKNKNYSNEFIKMLNEVKTKAWPFFKLKTKRKVYAITKTIAFSVDQISLTNYQFNIFLPIPNQSPNENITIQEPIQINQNIKSFPKLENFNTALRINQPCIKITFNHNLIDSTSLTSPNIKVGLDIFKKIEKIDEGWFRNRKVYSLNASKRKLACWLSLNRLLNLLIEKEKSRIRLGYLKTYEIFNEETKSIQNFKKYFVTDKSDEIGNGGGNYKKSDLTNERQTQEDPDISESTIYRNKSWIIENLKLLIDESLSKFCNDKDISVVSRSLDKQILNSVDYRIFKKFKIFKWYANSYETFNFQLSSNPGDLTAYVCCLSFLSNCKYSIGEKRKSGCYLPLGLSHYSSFTSLNFMETHLNQWQLFRYLMIESFDLIKDDKNTWNPKLLDKVTSEHYYKCLSQSEGYIEIINKMNRFEVLRRIENQFQISGGTNGKNPHENHDDSLSLMRCIVTNITADKVIAYWCDMDVEVEIRTDLDRVTIGDRLLCSTILQIDPLSDVIVLK